MTEIGVISDTHGLLRPQAITALEGVSKILHLGDVGPEGILERLSLLAPVTAVRGNVDRAPWCERLPETTVVDVEQVKLLLIHDPAHLAEPVTGLDLTAVLHGHTHQPREDWRDGILYLNPGSAGPRRFKLPITLARLTVDKEQLTVRFVELEAESDA